MRRVFAAAGFVALSGALVMSFLLAPTSHLRASSGDSATFLIPAADGYGIADCLIGGGDCGLVVAQSWCEAHGWGRAASFGRAAAEDMTGSTAPIVTVSGNLSGAGARPLSITCID